MTEEEIQVGLFRVPIPTYDRRAFREAFINSLVHRDYSLRARVYRGTGQKADYVRQAGFNPNQQEQMVLADIDKHGSIKNNKSLIGHF